MASSAVILTSVDQEDGLGDGTDLNSCVGIAQPLILQDDADSLVENLQSQADNISYEVEKIVGFHKDDTSGNTFYQVRLVAYSWLAEECLGSFQHLINDFLESVQQDVVSSVSPCVEENEVINDGKQDVSQFNLTSEDVSQLNLSCEGVDAFSEEGEDVDKVSEDDDEDDDDDDDDDDDNEDAVDLVKHEAGDSAEIIKHEHLLADSQEVFPLPTALMVTIGPANAETKDTVSMMNTDPSVLHCKKCNQRFFLKSNLEVHLLFCKGNDGIVARSLSTEGIEVTVNTEEVDSSVTAVTSRQLSAPSEDQTFEYVPFDNNCNNCTTCPQRLPQGATVGDSLTDLAHLVSHSRIRNAGNNVKIYECDECDREFLFKYPMKMTSSGWLEKNFRSIFPIKKCKTQNDKPFRCSICNRGFEKESDKVGHEGTHTNTVSRYSCASCGTKFGTRDTLQDHYKASSECQPTKCDICGQTFIHSSHLKRHLSIHAGIKPFVCAICGHQFNQRSDLQRHEKKHFVNDMYFCLKCQQGFVTVDELKEHIESHKTDEGGKKVYACTRCEKVFGRRSHYVRHLTIHDGIKPYSCENCNKRFNQRTDLKRHQMSHVRKELKVLSNVSRTKNNNNSQYCIICNKVFTSQTAFLQHDLLHQKIMNSQKILSSGII